MYYLEAKLEPFLLAWCLVQDGTRKGGRETQCVGTKYLLELSLVSWVCICNAVSLIVSNSAIPLEEKLEPTGSEVACSFLLAKIA